LEFMDAASLRAVRNYQKDFDMPDMAGSGLLIELDGEPADLTKQRSQTEEIIKGSNPIMMMQADNKDEIDKLWAIRKALSPALYSITDKKTSEDICLPRDKILPILGVLKTIENKYHIPVATFGHLGDGNLHVNFLVSTPAHQAELEPAVDELFRSVIGLGGALSGEHGIGLTKSKYLPLEVGPVEMALMNQVKTAFDPKGIMNPGKIFPPGRSAD
ncbi:MAG: hypothetical protein HY806_07300, partial [Nitrospirae bacterium]|nr:hypothetical protein [Nitrospirota bacterium]